MDWPRILPDFKPEGSLRDIYVLRTTLVDWQRVLDGLRVRSPAPILLFGEEPVPLPARIEDIFAASREAGALLSLEVSAGAWLNCHFFVEYEIEFDLDPRQVKGRGDVEAFIRFMEFLGEATNKAVLLTFENSPEAVIFRYSPNRKEVEWVGPPYG